MRKDPGFASLVDEQSRTVRRTGGRDCPGSRGQDLARPAAATWAGRRRAPGRDRVVLWVRKDTSPDWIRDPCDGESGPAARGPLRRHDAPAYGWTESEHVLAAQPYDGGRLSAVEVATLDRTAGHWDTWPP